MRLAVLLFRRSSLLLQQFTHWLGLGLCHQLPQRSYFGGGVQAPVCARDTGIYLGFVVAFLLTILLHRGEKPRDFPRDYVWIVIGLLVAAMGWDGVTSYAGLRLTTNPTRLATGLGVGFAIAPVLLVMINDVLWKRSSAIRVLDPIWRFGVWLAALPATFVVLSVVGPRIGVVYIILISFAVIATLTAVNLVIVGFLPPFDRHASRLRDLLVPTAVALAVTFLEITAAGQLRVFLDALARRG